jgi:2-oxoglutarate ferredoxin oxidoreductase subunit gamma
MPLLDRAGLAFINSSLCKFRADARHILLPATEIADRLGNTRAANFVLLGAWLARKPLIEAGAVESALPDHFPDAPAALIEINLKAFRAGLDG